MQIKVPSKNNQKTTQQTAYITPFSVVNGDAKRKPIAQTDINVIFKLKKLIIATY